MKLTKQSPSDLLLSVFVFMTAMIAVNANAAGSGDPLNNFKDYTDVGNKTISLEEQSGLQKSLASLFDILKVAFVLIGFGLFGGGVLKVVKASKTEGQQSQTPGWIMIAMGSVLSVAGILFFAFGQGIKNALVK
jgi:hypothetical protein